MPLTPAYAFTDYRSQGQTIKHAIIDIGMPPTGGLTPFNIYVALLLSSHPSKEDERLQKLDKGMKDFWDSIQKSCTTSTTMPTAL
ncbi:hypothetical protein EDC04DRAFT_2576003 [Pisolithus marmoratus]|nr:hypothetical protein EDC04DRAFT_2576003 [Pisolithus marmoratus]